MSKFLFAWGSNQQNQCTVNNSTKTISMKSGFENRVLIDQNIKYVKCGSSHSVILTREGHVYGWGNNQYNQLGDGSNKIVKPTRINIPHTCIKSKSEFIASVPIKNISCGGLFTIFVTHCNCIIKYGSIIGDINPSLKLDFPCSVGYISKVSCGQCHVVLLLSSGQVACFGRNMYGQIGIPRKDLDNNVETVSIPRVVTSHFVHRVIKIAAGTYHTLCVDEINQIFCWGYGLPCGVLNGHIMQPSHLPGIHEHIADLVGGSNHSLFLTNNKKLYAIGSNDFGQADPNSLYPFINNPIELKNFDQNVTNIYCSDNYSAVRTENDEIHLWGKISYIVNAECQNSDVFEKSFKMSMNDLLGDNYRINSLSFGSWHIVCVLSPYQDEYGDYSENCSTSESTYGSESVEFLPETIDMHNTKTNVQILNRERTHTTLKELYSKTPEIKSIETKVHLKNLNEPRIHKYESSKTNSRIKDNSTLIINKNELKIDFENHKENQASVNLQDNSNQIDVNLTSDKRVSNTNFQIHNFDTKNKMNYLKKCKTEFIMQSKIKIISNNKSLTNTKENLKLPILVPGLINLQLTKNYTYGGFETFKFGNKIKGILERSKILCRKNIF